MQYFSFFFLNFTQWQSVNQSVWCWPACRPCVGFLKPVAATGGLVSGYKLAKYDRVGAAAGRVFTNLLMDDPLTSRPPHRPPGAVLCWEKRNYGGGGGAIIVATKTSEITQITAVARLVDSVRFCETIKNTDCIFLTLVHYLNSNYLPTQIMENTSTPQTIFEVQTWPSSCVHSPNNKTKSYLTLPIEVAARTRCRYYWVPLSSCLHANNTSQSHNNKGVANIWKNESIHEWKE